MAKPVPEGYHTVTPNLTVTNAAEAIALYQKAFGAEVLDKAMDPSGTKVWHAALKLGDSMVFLNDEMPEMGNPAHPSRLWLYLPDCDAAFERAKAAGMTARMPPTDMFWGDRSGQLADRFGNVWTLATHKQDMTPAEMKRAQDEFVAAQAKKK